RSPDEEGGGVRAGGTRPGGHPARGGAREKAGAEDVHTEHGERRAGGAEERGRGHARRGDPGRIQMWSTRPIESRAASAIASDSVGWAGIARSPSSPVYSFVRATTSSWIISEACDPTMCAPTISPYLVSRMILTRPSVSLDVRARPLALKGNRPTWIARPLALACSSVRPTLATSGWQYVTLGTLVWSMGRGGWPASSLATARPSRGPLLAAI